MNLQGGILLGSHVDDRLLCESHDLWQSNCYKTLSGERGFRGEVRRVIVNALFGLVISYEIDYTRD